MTFQIIVEPGDGQFTAKLLGDHSLCVVRSTRDEAVEAMAQEIERRVERGEIVSVELPNMRGAAAVAGMFKDDPTLREIVEEIYTERDRQRDELPE